MQSISYSNQKHKSQSFSFQNLEPMNYLKTFNKMLQYMGKSIPSQNTQASRELKLVKLSRYPLHPHYEQMQGILEGHHKKHKQNYKFKKRDFYLTQNEEIFLKKHHQFVKNALHKIIQDNQSQQKLLQKQKKNFFSKNIDSLSLQHQAEILKLVRLRSEPKIRSIKGTLKSQRQFGKTNPQKLVKGEFEFKAKTERLQQKIPSSMIQNMRVLKSRKLNDGQDDVSSKSRKQQRWNNKFSKEQMVSNQQYNQKKQSNHQVHNQSILKITEPQHQKLHPFTERKFHRATELTNYQANKPFSETEKFEKQTNQPKISNFNVKGPIGFNHPISNLMGDQSQLSPTLQKGTIKNYQSSSIKNQIEQTSKIPLKQIETQQTKFKKLIQTLQKQQTETQNIFSQNVQSKISSINSKINERIQNVKSFDCSYK